MRDFYEDDYSDDPVFYDDELSFSDIPAENWSLCGNCHNYKPCGICWLDKHEVNADDGCTYNLKKEKR